jgi:hypothetical protein
MISRTSDNQSWPDGVAIELEEVTEENIMDNFTFNHFCNWLNDHIREDERMSVMRKMYERFLSDPGYWSTKDWDHLRICATRVL